MQIFFDHIAGQTEKREIYYAPATAIFEKHEYEYALLNGWQIATSWSDQDFDWFDAQKEKNIDVWYQARVTRICVDKFNEKAKHRSKIKKANVSTKIVDKPQIDSYWNIYKKYIESKNYYDTYKKPTVLFSNVYGDRKYLEYYSQNKLIAFSIIEIIGETAIAMQFCWDYFEPKKKLGYANHYFRLRYLKKLGVKYLHLGTSYEKGSLKKCDISGFQWWTGRSWCDDVELYRQLIHGESKMHTFDDLHLQQRLFYSKLDI